MSMRYVILTLLILIFGLLVALQLWISWESQQRAQRAIDELRNLQVTELESERVRQETINERIANEQSTVLFHSFVTNLSVIVGVLAAFSGAWIGLSQYIDVKQKEQMENNRQRLDRASMDLNILWEGISKLETRAASVAGMQQYLYKDKQEFHHRVAMALALVGRLDNDTTTYRTLAPIIEYAMRECRDAMKAVSWQGLMLYQPNFAHCDLIDFDFRDCILIEPDFTGANLQGCRLNAARLIGGKFDGANLSDANLEYADLAYASLCDANLEGANLNNIRLLNSDWANANIRKAKLILKALDWRLTKNWRYAQMDDGLKQRLIERLGPNTTGPHILMLLWEFYPVVSGGGWTAAYHMLLNLRKQGVRISVMIPWSAQEISYEIFGNEIEVITLGEASKSTAQESRDAFSSYLENTLPSGRENAFGTYYGEYNRSDTNYNRFGARDYDSYERLPPWPNRHGSGAYSSKKLSQSMFQRIDTFVERALQEIEEKNLKFDIIHAHDWVTFRAAEAISTFLKIPWVAHFHSTENDRNETNPDYAIKRIEQAAVQNARHFVTPSNLTKQRIIEDYEADETRISVVPNCLSPSNINLVSEFQTKEIVYFGRVAYQKGADLFAKLARLAHDRGLNYNFVMIGDGGMSVAESYIETIALKSYYVRGEARFGSIRSSVKIEKIADAVFDEESSEYLIGKVYEIKPEKKGQATSEGETLAQNILARGFTVHIVAIPLGYSHLISVKETGTKDRYFYIATNDIQEPSPRTITHKFLSKKESLNWQQRYSAFENASLVVVPSRYEPFGLVILEAMQAGVPVMYPRTAGVNDVIQSGIKIDPYDTEDMLEKLTTVLRDEKIWRELIAAQNEEMKEYANRHYERSLPALWQRLIDDQQKQLH